MTTPTTSRGIARQHSFIEAAAELFLEKGYSRTSLSEIVERSKGSRATLYKQFGNKEGLLRKIVEDVTEQVWQDVRWDDETTEMTVDHLSSIGARFCDAARTCGAVAVYRILVAEGHLVPDVANLFYQLGPLRFQKKMSELFSKAQKQGVVLSEDPDDLAEIFLGSVFGESNIFLELSLSQPRRKVDSEAYIRAAVRVFMNGMFAKQTEPA